MLDRVVKGERAEAIQLGGQGAKSGVVELKIVFVSGEEKVAVTGLNRERSAEDAFDLMDDLPGVLYPELTAAQNIDGTEGQPGVEGDDDDREEEESGYDDAAGLRLHAVAPFYRWLFARGGRWSDEAGRRLAGGSALLLFPRGRAARLEFFDRVIESLNPGKSLGLSLRHAAIEVGVVPAGLSGGLQRVEEEIVLARGETAG